MFDNTLIISRSSVILFFRTFQISDSLIQSIINTVLWPTFIYEVFKFPKVFKVQMGIWLSFNRKELVLRHTKQFALNRSHSQNTLGLHYSKDYELIFLAYSKFPNNALMIWYSPISVSIVWLSSVRSYTRVDKTVE